MRWFRPCHCLAALCLVAPCIAQDEQDGFPAHVVLRAVVTANAAAGAGGVEDAALVTEACVPETLSIAWQGSFKSAVDEMLKKTKRSMQRGLSDLSQAVVDLVDKATCGEMLALERLREQAVRLNVLTSFRSLGHLDSKVKYEPLQALAVGDIDIHSELNGVLIAWQMRKPADVLGSSLAMLLHRFVSDGAEEQPEGSLEATPPLLEPGELAPPAVPEDTRTAKFWADVMNRAFSRLGDSSTPLGQECVGEALAQQQRDLLDSAFGSMMQKSRKGMQQGLRRIADGVVELSEQLEAACTGARHSPAMLRLRSAAKRLHVLAMAKSLIKPGGVHVEYEPMKALTVGGVDVHLELNRFIGAWLHRKGPEALGEALADFFDDFRAQEEPDAGDADAAHAKGDDPPIRRMLREALAAAGGAEELEASCFQVLALQAFVESANEAIDEMLKKRMRAMQQGLRAFADAVERLFLAQHAACVSSAGAKVMRLGANKLRGVTRRLVVDYGTHIRYEAMKSLEVGGVACHVELNSFLAAWKLRSPEESGEAFGKLMAKMSTIPGYDEL